VIHVTIQQLSSYLDEQLAEGSADLVRQHLAACPECESRLGAFSRMDAALTRALSHDPGDDLLRRIERAVSSALGPDVMAKADEILAAASAKTSTPVRPAATKTTAGVVSSSRAVPNARVPAATVAATKTKGRDIPATAWTPSTEREAVGTPAAAASRRSKSSSRGTWVVIFSLAIIAGSAGVMVSHSGTVQGWLDSLVSDPNFSTTPLRAPRDVEQIAVADSDSSAVAPIDSASGAAVGATDGASAAGVPIAPGVAPPPRIAQVHDSDVQEDSEESAEAFTDEETAPQTMRADEVLASGTSAPSGRAASGRSGAGSRQSDPYANLRPETQAQVRDAERVHQQTLFHPTAEQFDTAALRWERVLEGMSGQEQVVVRGRLADARYRAWEAGPTTQRADAAIAALRSYLLFAPPGITREEAKARLENISPR
jgi:hypothetical protein